MATAKLPYHISVLTDELKDCVEDITQVLKHLSHLIESLSSKKKICLYKKPKPWVLLVENNPTLCYIHQRLLEELGCTVEAVSDIYQALERIDRGFDYIFCASPSGKQAIEFANQIHLREQKQRPRLIAISDTSSVEFKRQCLMVGIKEVITTPLSYQSLKELLTQWQGEIEGC